METTTIVLITLAVIAGLTLIVVLLKSLVLAEMGAGSSAQEPVRSVLGEDYYLDFTGPGHRLTRTTRTTDLSHLEIKDAPEMTSEQRAHQAQKKKGR